MESYEMSKTYQYRKVMKPMLERKRRARINKCLDELKDLMVDCMKEQGDNCAKLEKADILELTVDHLKKLRHTRQFQPLRESFRSGFVHAANEVSRALASVPGVDIQLGTKLMTHLGQRLNQIQESQKHLLSQEKPAVAPLTVVCGPGSYYSSAQLSPASSGYGSDSDCYSPVGSQQGLLQIAPVAQKDVVWRPW